MAGQCSPTVTTFDPFMSLFMCDTVKDKRFVFQSSSYNAVLICMYCIVAPLEGHWCMVGSVCWPFVKDLADRLTNQPHDFASAYLLRTLLHINLSSSSQKYSMYSYSLIFYGCHAHSYASLMFCQVMMCGLCFLILFMGNFFTTVAVVRQKLKNKSQKPKRQWCVKKTSRKTTSHTPLPPWKPKSAPSPSLSTSFTIS